MKRWTWIIVLLAALVPALAGAQGIYPPELTGVPADGVSRVLLTPTEYFNPPYSVPLDQSVAWQAQIGVGILPPFPILVEFDCLINYLGRCIVPPPPGLVFAEFPWDHDAGCYMVTEDFDGGASKSIDAFVFDGSGWKHYYGVVSYTGSPNPWYDWDWYFMDSDSGFELFRPHQQAPLATD